jgi:hypothetical protein
VLALASVSWGRSPSLAPGPAKVTLPSLCHRLPEHLHPMPCPYGKSTSLSQLETTRFMRMRTMLRLRCTVDSLTGRDATSREPIHAGASTRASEQASCRQFVHRGT